MCGFVPMQGTGGRRECVIALHGDDVALRIDDDHGIDTEALREALPGPREQAWTGVRFGGSEPFDGLFLWLATCLPGFALLTRQRSDTARELADPSSPAGTPALIEGGSFAYHTFRQVDAAASTYEFGAYAHGPDAARLAAQMAGQIQVWDREHRRDDARIAVYPAGTPDGQLPGWPRPRPAAREDHDLLALTLRAGPGGPKSVQRKGPSCTPQPSLSPTRAWGLTPTSTWISASWSRDRWSRTCCAAPTTAATAPAGPPARAAGPDTGSSQPGPGGSRPAPACSRP